MTEGKYYLTNATLILRPKTNTQLTMEGKTILVVDDEQDLLEILQFNLQSEGYKVVTAASAEEALKLDLSGIDLILLDIMMGEMSGFKMAEILKAKPQTQDIPIIFLTARDTENDTIAGFNLGADDYIAKPFSLKEVLVRIRAVLRRYESAQPSQAPLQYEGLQLDLQKKSVTVDGEPVRFTKTEFELLRILIEERGKVLSRNDLLQRVWPKDVCVLDRTVDVNVTRIRRKIGRYGKCIVTRQGFGYMFDAL